MRFRTDGWHYADLKAHGWTAETYFAHRTITEEEKKEWDDCPKAEPGDVWRIRWHSHGGDGPIAGYAICCIGCGHVHAWTTASNCNLKFQTNWRDDKGVDHPYWTCPHSGTGSCWEWSGSAEEGTLTAKPSLQVIAINPGDCNWHGYIENGDVHL